MLYAVGYGVLSSVAVDPIEKKPLYHFHPGKPILSIGGWGCNFTCGFCQNAEISQRGVDTARALTVSPEELLLHARDIRGVIGIAYTYNEPLINVEYVRDCAVLFRREGFANVLVTNGYINPEPLADLVPYIAAANVDLKSFSASFYERECGGRLRHVQRTIEAMVRAGVHVELTTLVIPGCNDSEEEIRRLAEYVAGLSPDIPLHLSRYFPQHQYRRPPTPFETLVRLHAAASAHLRHVYIGNVKDDSYAATRCPRCRSVVVARYGFHADTSGLAGVSCRACGNPLPFVV